MGASNFTPLFNLQNYTELGMQFYPADYPKECLVEGKYSLECLHATICPQFTSYFINVGIAIIISYILISWLLWWYMKHGYKKLPLPKNEFFGDINNLETRIYWDTWVRARISKLMLGFIAVVVWLSINRKI